MTRAEDKRLSAQIILLCLIGVFFSAWILNHHFALKNAALSSGPSFCSINETFDCDVVAKSSASEWFGVPVAGFGILFYLTFLASALVFVPSNGYGVQQTRGVYFFLSIVGIVPAAYLLLVSAFIIGTYCPLCLVLDGVNLVLLIVAVYSLAGKYPLLDSLIIGFETAASALAEALYIRTPDAPRRKIIQLMLLLILFCAVMLFQLPAYFARTAKSSVDDPFQKEIIRNFVYQWSRSSTADITLDLTGDLKTRDFSLGSENASITILTFSDFQCPACKKISFVMEDIVKKNPEARLVFKNYPLDKSCNPVIQRKVHEFACRAGQMARCAGEQGPESFWAMHDALYSLEFFNSAQLDKLSADVGLDKAAFDGCMASEHSMHRVEQDVAEGNILRVDHTPSIFINGKHVHAATPENLLSIVEALKAESVSN